MTIDWAAKLRHLLQVVAFCLGIATVLYAFAPDRPYGPNVVYSLFIGTIMWAVIDIGRHVMPASAETGWPRGITGALLVVAGIATGYVVGSQLAAQVCVYFGWLPEARGPEHQGHWRITMLISLVAGVVASFYFYSQTRSAYLERQMREARSRASEARLRLLESQLEPHMLFNTLANLRVLIGADPQRAQGMLDHMIDYLRATLDASRSTTHSLQAEFDRLRDYLELMAIRMGPRLRYSLLLPPELASCPVPALLLQPLVENSVQHGLEPKVEGGEVRVSARREGRLLLLEVADSGVGDAASKSGGGGFGLQQVRERLATLYGADGRLEFSADGSGATTTLRLPIAP